MTDLSIRELDAVLKYLKKVNEVQELNEDNRTHVDIDIPERIALTRPSDGELIGHIVYSDDIAEHVFIPHMPVPEPERQAPQWTIPIPPPFD